MKAREHDIVVLTEKVPDVGLEAGDVGTVVHVHERGVGYEVEFTTLQSETVAVVTLRPSQFRSIRQKVFLAKTREQELDSETPCAEMVDYHAAYFFLYPAILRLQQQTGELIDFQKDAFFVGQTLDALEEFLATSKREVASQPEYWEQRVGRSWPDGKPVFEHTSRAELLEVLEKLLAAVAVARQNEVGLFFEGE